jgi:hypothetical protein
VIKKVVQAITNVKKILQRIFKKINKGCDPISIHFTSLRAKKLSNLYTETIRNIFKVCLNDNQILSVQGVHLKFCSSSLWSVKR